jgi:hypothetical protein
MERKRNPPKSRRPRRRDWRLLVSQLYLDITASRGGIDFDRPPSITTGDEVIVTLSD